LSEAAVKFEGETVRLGGQEYILPSLSTGKARKLWPAILEIDKGVTPETMPQKFETMIAIIHAALARNYPELTVDEVGELVDLRRAPDLCLQICRLSGMAIKDPQAPAAGGGEATASTGPISTGPSSREPAGASNT